MQRLQKLRDLLTALGRLLAKAGGEGIDVRSMGGDEFLDGGNLRRKAFRPGSVRW